MAMTKHPTENYKGFVILLQAPCNKITDAL